MGLISSVRLRLKKYFASRDFKISRSGIKPIKIISQGDKYYLIFKNKGDPKSYFSALSFDGIDFSLTESYQKPDNFEEKFTSSAVVSNFSLGQKKILYFGDRHIYLAQSTKKGNWVATRKPLIVSPYPTQVGGAFLFPKGILVLYFEKTIEEGVTYYKAYVAEFDKKDPCKMLWKTQRSIWDSKDHWIGKKAVSLGSVLIKDKIVMYWYVENKIIYAVYLSGFFLIRYLYKDYKTDCKNTPKIRSLVLDQKINGRLLPLLIPRRPISIKKFISYTALKDLTIFQV